MSNNGPANDTETVEIMSPTLLFMHASLKGDVSALKFLNEKSKFSDFTKGLALHNAMRKGHKQCEAYLLE